MKKFLSFLIVIFIFISTSVFAANTTEQFFVYIPDNITLDEYGEGNFKITSDMSDTYHTDKLVLSINDFGKLQNEEYVDIDVEYEIIDENSDLSIKCGEVVTEFDKYNNKEKLLSILLNEVPKYSGKYYDNITFGVEAVQKEGVYITDILYQDSTGDYEDIQINESTKTNINSSLILMNEASSYISYDITVFNSYDEDYMFVGAECDELYSNENIVLEFDQTEIYVGKKIKPQSYFTFNVTFGYKNDTLPTDNNCELNSIINYRFESAEQSVTLSGIEFNYLLKNSEYAPEGDVYEYYSKDANRKQDYTVKRIIFGKTSDYADDVADLVKEPIDIYRTGTISMYRETDTDSKLIVYILSDTGAFNLNANSSWMFDKLYELEEIINLHLLNTDDVIYMRDMFCDCAKLKNVDLSNFETEKVVNMIGMFARMTEIEYLDLTTFDTSSVTEMGQMFTTDSALKRIYVSSDWSITDKVLAADGAGVFTACTNLIGGNGTKYDETKITYTMAVIDGTSPGYLTANYKLDTGIQVNHMIKNKTQAEIDAWTLSTRFKDTTVKTITFGKTSDYYEDVMNYTGIAVDSHGSGVIKVYRKPNGSMWDVYILSNNGKFVANEDSAWLFDNLILMTNINNLNMLDTSKVTNMRDVFCDCQTIKTLDLSNFSTVSATTFEGMFARMYFIEVLDLSNFNTKNLTTIKSMFVHSKSATETYADYMDVNPALKTIYVSNLWDVSKMASEVIFSNNTNLVGGNGTAFNSANVSATYARVDTDSTPGYLTLK